MLWISVRVYKPSFSQPLFDVKCDIRLSVEACCDCEPVRRRALLFILPTLVPEVTERLPWEVLLGWSPRKMGRLDLMDSFDS